MKKNGSITVYACLMLAVLLPLLLASLQSVKLASARVEIAAAADQGMYSLFAGYEPKLLEWYDLFLFDGGYGSGNLRQEEWYKSVEKDTARILEPLPGDRIYGSRLNDIQITGGGITGYRLIGDNREEALSGQIYAYMKQNLGISGINRLKDSLGRAEDTVRNQKAQKDQMDEQQAEREYEEQTAPAEGSSQESAEAPADFVNPIEAIRKLRKQGILTLVLPEGAVLSEAEAELSSLYSHRQRYCGMGLVPPEQPEDGNRFLSAEYLKEKCTCYTDAGEAQGLQYQLEYILNGKESDQKNLKSTAGLLLLLREASNLAFLLHNPEKRTEAEAAGISIATGLMVPPAAPAVTKLLQICWAFGESVLDLRELLEGGKVALVKDRDSWQMDLNALAELVSRGDEFRRSSEKGLTYKEYLELLLLTGTGEKHLERFLDIAEMRMRTEGGKPEFRMDCCVTAAEMELDCCVDNSYFYTVRRGYGY